MKAQAHLSLEALRDEQAARQARGIRLLGIGEEYPLKRVLDINPHLNDTCEPQWRFTLGELRLQG